MSVIQRIGLTRPFVRVVAVSSLLALAGCGGDDEQRSADTTPAATQPAATETATTETAPAATDTGTAPAATETSPEEQPGGAGDEEPARSEAMFTGRGGRISPRVVRVPPFIAIRVSLRSADGSSYELRFGDRSLRVDRTKRSASADFAGLRSGRALVGESTPAGSRVRVEATAEPGP